MQHRTINEIITALNIIKDMADNGSNKLFMRDKNTSAFLFKELMNMRSDLMSLLEKNDHDDKWDSVNGGYLL